MHHKLRKIYLENDSTFFRDVYDYVGDTIEFAFFIIGVRALELNMDELENIIDLVDNEMYDELPTEFRRAVDLLLRTGSVHNSKIVAHLEEFREMKSKIKLTTRLVVV